MVKNNSLEAAGRTVKLIVTETGSIVLGSPIRYVGAGPGSRSVSPFLASRQLRRGSQSLKHPEHTKLMDFNNTRYIPMSRRRRIYEGKAKVLYEGPEPGTLIQHFKDDATAFNAKKHQVIEGKGVLNNRISEYLFQHLNDI